MVFNNRMIIDKFTVQTCRISAGRVEKKTTAAQESVFYANTNKLFIYIQIFVTGSRSG